MDFEVGDTVLYTQRTYKLKEQITKVVKITPKGFVYIECTGAKFKPNGSSTESGWIKKITESEEKEIREKWKRNETIEDCKEKLRLLSGVDNKQLSYNLACKLLEVISRENKESDN